MMKRIEIHEPSSWLSNKDWVMSYVPQNVIEKLEVIYLLRDNVSKVNFWSIKGEISRTLGYAYLYNTTNYTFNYLYYSNQLNKAWYKYAMNAGKPVTIQIADKTIETVGKFEEGDYHGVSSHYALSGFYTSIILRDKPNQLFFADVPLDFINSYGQEDMISETMLLFYQLLAKGTGTKDEAHGAYYHISQHLNWEHYRQYIIIEGYNSEYIWKEVLFKNRVRKATYIFLPVLNIYHQILHGSQVGYEKAVYDALLKWKEHWTLKYLDENQEEWDLSTDPEGYIALPIIAACAYAYDRGMKLGTVESDYIPRWMIEERFEDFELLVKG
jgi:hypothetical protein